MIKRFLGWLLSPLLRWLITRLREEHEVRGFRVVLDNTRPDIDTDAVLERFKEALDLLATYQPWRFAHMKRDVALFWIVRQPYRGSYTPACNRVMTELTFLARRDISAAVVASSILHEGVHARVHHMGVRPESRDRAREERLCRKAELAFGEALPPDLGAPIIARAAESLALDDADVAPVINHELAQERQREADREALAAWRRGSAILVLSLAVGCAAPSAEDAPEEKAKSPIVTSVRDSGMAASLDELDAAVRAHLQQISPRVGSDTLRLFSPPDTREPGPMVGNAVGPSVERYFGSRFGMGLSDEDDIYAIGWLPIPPSHELYLLRTPSQYDVSAITAWLYDKSAGMWQGSFELADAFGDAGWSFEKQAWMTELPDSGEAVFVIRRVDRSVDLEEESNEERIGPDSLYAFSVRGWIRRTIWQQNLPDSDRRRYPLTDAR